MKDLSKLYIADYESARQEGLREIRDVLPLLVKGETYKGYISASAGLWTAVEVAYSACRGYWYASCLEVKSSSMGAVQGLANALQCTWAMPMYGPWAETTVGSLEKEQDTVVLIYFESLIPITEEMYF